MRHRYHISGFYCCMPSVHISNNPKYFIFWVLYSVCNDELINVALPSVFLHLTTFFIFLTYQPNKIIKALDEAMISALEVNSCLSPDETGLM